MEQIFNYVLQIKGLLGTIFVLMGMVYFVKSGALAEITGSWKRRYEAVVGERDDLKAKLVSELAAKDTQIAIKDAKIKDLDDYIKILVLNEKTRMEIEIQKHA